MDVALWCYINGKTPFELAKELNLDKKVAEFVYKDIENKRKMTEYLASEAEKIMNKYES